jgi:hypothetical protein
LYRKGTQYTRAGAEDESNEAAGEDHSMYFVSAGTFARLMSLELTRRRKAPIRDSESDR